MTKPPQAVFPPPLTSDQTLVLQILRDGGETADLPDWMIEDCLGPGGSKVDQASIGSLTSRAPLGSRAKPQVKPVAWRPHSCGRPQEDQSASSVFSFAVCWIVSGGRGRRCAFLTSFRSSPQKSTAKSILNSICVDSHHPLRRAPQRRQTGVSCTGDILPCSPISLLRTMLPEISGLLSVSLRCSCSG